MHCEPLLFLSLGSGFGLGGLGGLGCFTGLGAGDLGCFTGLGGGGGGGFSTGLDLGGLTVLSINGLSVEEQ